MELKHLFLASLGVMTLAACSSLDDDSTWDVNGGAVKFTSYISKHKATGTTWASGDQIGIYMKTNGTALADAAVQNRQYVTDDRGNISAASAAEAIYYPEEGTADFVAYYPYTANVSGTILPIDVSNQSNLAAIDLLYSNNATGVSASTSAVNLGFSHQLANVVLTINADATIPTTVGLEAAVSGVPTSATFDLATGTLNVAQTTGTVNFQVNAAGTKAEAILVPASLTNAQLQLTVAEKTVSVPLPASALEAGKSIDFPVNVTNSGGTIYVSFGTATITDWTTTTGGTINVDLGDAEEGGEEGGGEVTPGTEVIIFEETFGESVSKGSDNYWPSITYDTWTSSSGLTFSDPFVTANGWSYSNASVRQTSALNPHVWFAANKDSEMQIEGFTTAGYSNLKLTYDITANAAGDQSAIKLTWGGDTIAVPAKAIATTNTYQSVEITGLTPGATVMSFVSLSTANTAGYRIDNIKLVGTKD